MTPIEVLQTTFGYHQFRGQQEAVIQTLMQGDDALVIMPTGGGKSLCYQIPAILRPGCGVVISPLIALMQDQVDGLRLLGIQAAFLNSTQPLMEVQRIEAALLAGQLDLLYIAPERLNQARTVSLLQRCPIALFAIDEAHCVSQWGHDFRVDYLQLHRLADEFPRVPRMALTATADARTRQEISERLALNQPRSFIANFDRPNIRYSITLKREPKRQLLDFLSNRHPGEAGIVYCLSRKKTEAIAQWLCTRGLTALPYHAGLDHRQRAANQQRFLREEAIIIVATIAFGMGIDKPDVRFVVHLDLPKSIEAYYQETGRAGRDGQPADAWMVYGLEDVIKLRQMMGTNDLAQPGFDNQGAEYKRVEWQKLEAMLGLCEITTCRRHALLQYFGDQSPEACGNCDACLEPVATWNGTEAAQKAISCAYRTGQRFGVAHLVDVLCGANTEKITQFRHQQLSVYGIGKELNKQQWRSVYRQLIARNYLHIDFARYNAVTLHEKCRPLLQGKETIALRQDPAAREAINKITPTRTGHAQGPLWEALRECRSRLASEQGVPPYVIFHDSTLMEMVANQPQTLEQFARLSGVGESKQRQYADTFLAVIKEYGQPGHQSPAEENYLSDTWLETLALLRTGLSVNEVAQQRGLASSTIYTHCSHLIRHGQVTLDQVIDLSDEDIKRIEDCLVDCGVVEENGRLKPVYEALGEAYSYDALRCVFMNFLKKLAGA